MRLFVALDIPEEIAEAFAAMQSGLQGARWSHPENLHLTLAFIGEATRRQCDDICAALTNVSPPFFDISLSGFGHFGDTRPRALWAGVARNEGLTHLQSKVSNALRNVGVNLEARKFTPHVTLAYLKGAYVGDVQRWITEHSPLKLTPFPVGEFHLYVSHLSSERAYYEIIESYPLSFSR